MEMIEPTMLVILALVAFAAGFIDAVAGGGGMLTIPALLSIGLPPHIALGTNKLAASFASSTAAVTFYRKKLFKPQFWLHAFFATLIGATVGTFIVDAISTEWLEKAIPLIVLATAIYTIWHKSPPTTGTTLPEKCKKFTQTQWIQGITLGFYDGVAGPGTGAFWMVSSMAVYRLNILLASGLSKAMNFTSNFTSFVTFALLGHVNWVLGLTMGVCLMLGAYVGAHSAIKFGAKFIRPVFVTVVSIMAIKLAYEAWFL
ncbi:TSUP family transporter [Vibrio sp. 99-8-1]|uniref:TSUP family transporter n=1 Tax=Vibrio sp. 99-8-1 TaxID=2607602 RepID=UPI001493B6CB|nr:TSUP family transporter [Vibrio sp. 99-8-1]NOI66315.1 TSUP family transporter [Vibrio sp. 99-8-1]